jgi:hypothetical protein
MNRSPRFSIAGLMGVVLVAAIGLAALRNPTELWDGVMFLLTCGVLMLSVVGVVCRREGGRAWWLGFALFGWGYFTLAFWSPHELLPRLLSTALMQLVTPRMGAPGMMRGGGFRSVPPLLQFGAIGGGFLGGVNVGLSPFRIGHCLWTLLAAVLGGTLARLLFAAPAQRSDIPAAEPQPAPVPVRKWWRRPVLVGLAGLVLYTCVPWPVSDGRPASGPAAHSC